MAEAVLKGSITKTYSSDRVIPLNKKATETLERLCAKYPDCPYIICDSKQNLVPPERMERTFYYMLKNIGIEKTGVHSLRHAFASTLFAKKVDIKTISKLLGHANIQITLDTYSTCLKTSTTRPLRSSMMRSDEKEDDHGDLGQRCIMGQKIR